MIAVIIAAMIAAIKRMVAVIKCTALITAMFAVLADAIVAAMITI